jgi:hypothetical protein
MTPLAFGIVSALAQVLGLILAVAIPFDSQGAVGKAYVAIFTQIVAVPPAFLGILAALERLLAGKFDSKSAWGLIASAAGLLPLSLFYVWAVR